ncbi:MAG: hypothetical protein PUI29_05185 [Aeromonadales bacterium]|nr:hypothetical protein [Aeromonadales bacterium]MDY2891338.1 hypothetical protein [Succinivibrio sp.]
MSDYDNEFGYTELEKMLSDLVIREGEKVDESFDDSIDPEKLTLTRKHERRQLISKLVAKLKREAAAKKAAV